MKMGVNLIGPLTMTNKENFHCCVEDGKNVTIKKLEKFPLSENSNFGKIAKIVLFVEN
jgi:hypothetical protein